MALFVAAAVLTPALAHAAWFRAETDRFVLYGQGFESRVRAQAERLATFDRVLRTFHPSTVDRPPGQKVEIYAVSLGQLKQLMPNGPEHVRGFYAPTPDGLFIAYVASDDLIGSDDVLFHEYAHHFMWTNFPAAYPGWFSEGWAEYFMTTEITPKEIKVGGYNPNRAYWLFNSTWLPMDELLSKRSGEVKRSQRAIYYPQAWLFQHYMRSDPTRAAQLDKAVRDIALGAEPVKAVREATGQDMVQLAAALKKYQKLTLYKMRNGDKPELPVTVTRLPASANDLLLALPQMAVTAGHPRREEFLREVRRAAARFPDDRLAQFALARAEFHYGDVAAGEAIMKRRMEADPKDAEALRLAGMGQLIAGERDKVNKAARFRAARVLFGKAYHLDQSDYRTLFAYAFCRMGEPDYPSENDLNALLAAREMAPSVPHISLAAGAALLQRDRGREASIVLARVANDPHGGSMAAQARALIAGKSAADAAKVELSAQNGEGDDAPPEPDLPAAPDERSDP